MHHSDLQMHNCAFQKKAFETGVISAEEEQGSPRYPPEGLNSASGKDRVFSEHYDIHQFPERNWYAHEIISQNLSMNVHKQGRISFRRGGGDILGTENQNTNKNFALCYMSFFSLFEGLKGSWHFSRKLHNL